MTRGDMAEVGLIMVSETRAVMSEVGLIMVSMTHADMGDVELVIVRHVVTWVTWGWHW